MSEDKFTYDVNVSFSIPKILVTAHDKDKKILQFRHLLIKAP